MVLEEGSEQSWNRFSLGLFSEREDPGREDASVKSIPKVAGGFTPKCGDLAEALYGQALDKSIEFLRKVAEATKPSKIFP